MIQTEKPGTIQQGVLKRFQDEIPHVVEAVRSYGPRRVILFGSFATGDINTRSDIDLCVIKNTTERFMDRSYAALRLVHSSFPVEALVYTESEFERMTQEGNPLVARILNQGKVLYEQEQ